MMPAPKSVRSLQKWLEGLDLPHYVDAIVFADPHTAIVHDEWRTGEEDLGENLRHLLANVAAWRRDHPERATKKPFGLVLEMFDRGRKIGQHTVMFVLPPARAQRRERRDPPTSGTMWRLYDETFGEVYFSPSPRTNWKRDVPTGSWSIDTHAAFVLADALHELGHDRLASRLSNLAKKVRTQPGSTGFLLTDNDLTRYQSWMAVRKQIARVLERM